jgi:hypothetical protein
MDYPLTRTAAALTAVYNAYALARPDALVKGLEGQVDEAESTLLARTWAGRDLPVAALALAAPSPVRDVAVGLRIAADVTDATVLGLRTSGTPQRKALGVTLGWAALNALALVADRRRARGRA